MARLIDADALHAGMVESYMTLHKLYEDAQDEQTIKNIVGQLVVLAECTMRVKDAPTIDAEPVRHGRWAMMAGFPACSECGCSPADWEAKPDTPDETPPYCHSCGAKMDGGAE